MAAQNKYFRSMGTCKLNTEGPCAPQTMGFMQKNSTVHNNSFLRLYLCLMNHPH
jgi:hypothetical protein